MTDTLNVTVDRDALRAAVQPMTPITSGKTPIQVLAHVLLYTAGDSLMVAATDLYRCLRAEVPMRRKSAGGVSVTAKDLLAAIKTMPPGDVRIMQKGANVTIKAVRRTREVTLHGLAQDSFPLLPKTPAEGWTALPVEPLRSAIEQVAYCISTDETRAHVNSLSITSDGTTTTFAATDGHRLAVARRALSWPTGTALVPLDGVQTIRALLKSAKAVEVCVVSPHLFLRVGGKTFSVKLTDAEFPPWRQVLPTTTPHEVIVPRRRMLRALQSMAAVHNGKGYNGTSIVFDAGCLRLATTTAKGSVKDRVTAQSKGESVRSGVNLRYFVEALKGMDVPRVRITTAGELDPFLVTAPDEVAGAESFLSVIMPLRAA